jgi:hypothetical protein
MEFGHLTQLCVPITRIFDHLDICGTSIVDDSSVGTEQTIMAHLKSWVERNMCSEEQLKAFQGSAKRQEDPDKRRGFIMYRTVLEPNSMIVIPQGYVVIERTLGGATVSGFRLTYLEKSMLATRNMFDIFTMQKGLGHTGQTSTLLVKFFKGLSETFCWGDQVSASAAGATPTNL